MAIGWFQCLLDRPKLLTSSQTWFTENGKSRHHPRHGSGNVRKAYVNQSSFLTCYCSFEAMLYFLYTGEIRFAPFRSYTGHQLLTQERAGNRNATSLPSPSAKSIYRLADMVTSLAYAGVPRLTSLSTTCQP